MPALYDAVALWLVDVHLQGCALLAVAIIATMALHQPARRMAVMRATLAALAAIAVLCALPNWSVVHLTELRGHRAAHVSAEPVPAESPQIVYDAELDAYFAPVGQGSPVGVGETASLTGDLERASIWPLVVLGIQAIGSLAVAGWLAIGAMAARAVRNAACQVPAEIAEAFSATWPEAASLGRIELLASERVAAPVALGWRRPAIILPQRMMDEVGSDAFDSRDAAVQDRRKRKLAAFLAHELAHISAGDLRSLAASRWLLLLLWPQPLFWLLRRRLRLDQELLADSAAATVAGRADYADDLIAWARHAGPRSPRLVGAVGLWESSSQLKRRIAALLDGRFMVQQCSARWRVGAACAAIAAAVTVSLLTIQPGGPAEAMADGAATDTPAADAGDDSADDAGEPSDATPAPGEAVVAATEIPAWARHEPNVVQGIVVDHRGDALAGIEILLYSFLNDFTIKDPGVLRPIAVQVTNTEGRYRFENVVDVSHVFPDGLPDEQFLQSPIHVTHVVARGPGLATATFAGLSVRVVRDGEAGRMAMEPAQALRGRVVGPDGTPIAGAVVTAGLAGSLPLSINATTSDSEGRFAIEDLAAFDAEEARLTIDEWTRRNPEIAATRSSFAGRLPLFIRHPEFAAKRADVQRVPGDVQIRLEAAAVIEGQVTLPDGVGADGVKVRVVRIVPATGASMTPKLDLVQSTLVTTDKSGRYRMGELPAGAYSICAGARGWVTPGIGRLEAVAGETTTAPDIVLSRGATVRLQLVDAVSGEPFRLGKETRGWVNPLGSSSFPAVTYADLAGGVAFSPEGRCEFPLMGGRFLFHVTLPGTDSQGRYWTSTSLAGDASSSGRWHEIEEGRLHEIEVPMAKISLPTILAFTGTISPVGYPAEEQADGDASAESSTVDASVENGAAFVPYTPPSDAEP